MISKLKVVKHNFTKNNNAKDPLQSVLEQTQQSVTNTRRGKKNRIQDEDEKEEPQLPEEEDKVGQKPTKIFRSRESQEPSKSSSTTTNATSRTSRVRGSNIQQQQEEDDDDDDYPQTQPNDIIQ